MFGFPRCLLLSMVRGSSAVFAIIVIGGYSAQANAGTVTYDNEADFISDLHPDHYFEDFSTVPSGVSPSPMNFGPVNGYSYSVAAIVNGSFDNLFSSSSTDGISVNSGSAHLEITFTGGDVYMVGGNFWYAFGNAPDVTVSLNDGTSVILADPTPDTFAGFVSDTPIESFTVESTNGFPWMGNLYVGTTIPTPGTLALLGLACVCRGRRRRDT